MGTTRTAVVVGAGPNGMAAAVYLAQHGVRVTVLEAQSSIGGGTRTAELTLPGLAHDICSATHPFGVASPFLSQLPLGDFGLTWRWPEIDLVHPLEDGSAGVLQGDVRTTARGLGDDEGRWRRMFDPLVAAFPAIAQDALGPLLRVPAHPIRLAQFGLRAALPASVLARSFRTPQARALFLGCAAHLFQPLTRPLSASVGTMMIAAGHRHGWPVAEGGSQAITRALAGLFESLSGEIVLNTRVRSRDDLPAADLTLFDTTPTAFAEIIGADAPRRARRVYGSWRYGPAAYKVDLAVRGGIPWTAEAARRAGTIHLGGAAGTIIAAERDVAAGRLPDRPFILVAQQYLADPTRSVGDTHPIYAYAHVPNAYAGDATQTVLSEIDRYAPGFRERIVAQHVTTPADFASANSNYVGGDIAGGANSILQLLGRPMLSPDPYYTGLPGMYLCSASTPPGAGVHGLCGLHAARRAVRSLECA